MRAARRVECFRESVIREMTRLAEQYGAINLAQGFPDFSPPARLLEALEQASKLPLNHQYSITWGSPRLRRALADHLVPFLGRQLDPDSELTITCGATEGIVAAVMAVVDPGDVVVIMEPFYENYVPATLLVGGRPRFLTLHAPDFRWDPQELHRACRGARALIVNTPHNPTGRVFTLEEIEQLAEVVQRYGLICITDETYQHIVYDDRRHLSPARVEALRDSTIVVGSFSKTYSVTGWRVGYVAAPPALTEAVRRVHDFLTVAAPNPLQEAISTALRWGADYYQWLRSLYQRNRDLLVDGLHSIGLKCNVPEGAYYLLCDVTSWGFEDDTEAAKYLIRRAGVATVPGSSFYHRSDAGRRFVRFAFCKQESTLRRVIEGLQAVSLQA